MKSLDSLVNSPHSLMGWSPDLFCLHKKKKKKATVSCLGIEFSFTRLDIISPSSYKILFLIGLMLKQQSGEEWIRKMLQH